MNSAVLERRFILAQRHAQIAEELVDRQRQLVETLSPNSRVRAQARTLLRHLEDIHRLCMDDEHRVGIQYATTKLNRWRGH